MMSAPQPRRFNALQRVFHWSMAVMIVTMLFIGVAMVSTVRPDYPSLIMTHEALGSVIFMLVIVRLATRLYFGAPSLPADLPTPIRLVALSSQVALYGLMFAMPLLGWAMLSAANFPMTLFGMQIFPTFVPQNATLHAGLSMAHHYLAFAFFALVLMHVAAALFHGLIRRDGVFESMAPFSISRNASSVRDV